MNVPQDPTRSKDPKSFDKCYWLIYYSVQGFLKQIKEEAQELSNKRDAINLLAEDTVNHSMKNKTREIKHLDIDSSPYFSLEVPLKTLQIRVSASLSPPQAPPQDIPDVINYTHWPWHQHSILDPEQIIHGLVATTVPETERFQFRLSPAPQPPTEECDDIANTVQAVVKLFWEESIHSPRVHHLLPPLLYLVEHEELHLPTIADPADMIADRDIAVTRVREKVFLNSISTDIPLHTPLTPPSLINTDSSLCLSPPSPPFLPSYPPADSVNHPSTCRVPTPPVCPHTPQVWPPSVPHLVTVFREYCAWHPPQLAEYPCIEDVPNPPPRPVQRIPITPDTTLYIRRPARPCSLPRVDLTGQLSPPQEPDLPDRRTSRGEDLFDQVRRTSRAFNTFLF